MRRRPTRSAEGPRGPVGKELLQPKGVSGQLPDDRPLARNFVSPFPSPLYQASRTDFENFTRSAHVHSGGRQFAPGSIMLEGISPQSDTVGRLAPGWEGSHERKRSRLLLSGGSTGFPIPFLLIRPRS